MSHQRYMIIMGLKRDIYIVNIVSFNYWLNVRKEKWIQSPLTIQTARSFYV
jgi:hypothetical protein